MLIIKKLKKENFDMLCKNICESSVIVLFGIGLTTDPHILELMNSQKNKKIIIIDGNQSQYYKNHLINTKGTDLVFKFLLTNDIFFIETSTYKLREDKGVSKVDTPTKLLNDLDEIIEMFLNS